MMMPMVDPRMIPMIDPRMIPPQQMMMYDPRMMAHSPMIQQQQPYSSMIMPLPSISSGSSIVNGTRYQPSYSNEGTGSINTERRGKQSNTRRATAMSSAGSISNNSIRSTTTNSRYSSNTRRNTNQH